MIGQRQKKNKKGGIVLGVVVTIIIAMLIGIILFLLLSQNAQPEKEEEKRNVVITPENVERVLEEITETQETVAPGFYTVTMNTTWHFSSGTDASYDAVVENVEANTNDVYFDIVLEEDETKVLYQSPVIPRGGRLEGIALDEALKAGSYNCVVIYHLIDEEQNTLSTLRIGITIIVEN